MQTSVECVYVCNKFCMAPLCTTCLSRKFWMCLCSAMEAFDEPCENACSTSAAALSDIFVCVPFWKGGTDYSPTRTHAEQSPTSHPHNSRDHAHSCQLVPIFLLMPITAGKFTFITHSTKVPCPKFGHMLAHQWGKKTLIFFNSDMKVCVCVLA